MTATAEPVLRLRLTRIEYAAAAIHLYEFRAADGALLPAFVAGSHVDLHLANGLVRQCRRHRHHAGGLHGADAARAGPPVAEKQNNKVMMVSCSGSLGSELAVDL